MNTEQPSLTPEQATQIALERAIKEAFQRTFGGTEESPDPPATRATDAEAPADVRVDGPEATHDQLAPDPGLPGPDERGPGIVEATMTPQDRPGEPVEDVQAVQPVEDLQAVQPVEDLQAVQPVEDLQPSSRSRTSKPSSRSRTSKPSSRSRTSKAVQPSGRGPPSRPAGRGPPSRPAGRGRPSGRARPGGPGWPSRPRRDARRASTPRNRPRGGRRVTSFERGLGFGEESQVGWRLRISRVPTRRRHGRRTPRRNRGQPGPLLRRSARSARPHPAVRIGGRALECGWIGRIDARHASTTGTLDDPAPALVPVRPAAGDTGDGP